jgi:hypothetical protein
MVDGMAKEPWQLKIVGLERVEPHVERLTTVLNVAMEDGSEVPVALLDEYLEGITARSTESEKEELVRSWSVARDEQFQLLPQILITTDLGDPGYESQVESDLKKAADAVGQLSVLILDEISVVIETRRRQAKKAEEQIRRELSW